MEWTVVKYTKLSPLLIFSDDLAKNLPQKNTPGICMCCGGCFKFSKYLKYVFGKNHQVCEMCYMIIHISDISSINKLNEMVLCWSTLSQNEIIKKTASYIIKYRDTPKILDIDPNAQKLNFTLFEFQSLKSVVPKNTPLPPEFKNYKIFFTKNMSIAFLSQIEFNKQNKLILKNTDDAFSQDFITIATEEEDDCSGDDLDLDTAVKQKEIDDVEYDQNLKTYIMTGSETVFINKHIYNQ
jgi:hypothetical protein